MIGRKIFHYKIIEKLGEGGMGVVYKAEDTRLKRPVALKFLARELTPDSGARQRFLQEAQAASSLQHNNICTIHNIDETDDHQIFICMDHYDGETLKLMIDDRRLSIDEAVDIAIQIGEGLAKAHEQGTCSRGICHPRAQPIR
ncbi:MAG: serine/threonine protein kinase [bacterium]